MTDSLDMARFLASSHPSLSGPEPYVKEADDLLDKLHNMDLYALSYAHHPAISAKATLAIEKRLAEANTIQYKEALANKLKM